MWMVRGMSLDPGVESMHAQVLMERLRTARAKYEEDFILDPDERARAERYIEQLEEDLAKQNVELEVAVAMHKLECETA